MEARIVLFVVANRTEEDFHSLRTMTQGFKAAEARVVMFDDFHDPDSADPVGLKQESDVARQSEIEVVKVSPILAASPDKTRLLCLDHIHMTEPYHRLMAKQWLKVILKQPLIGS
jgi:hypothetical protein